MKYFWILLIFLTLLSQPASAVLVQADVNLFLSGTNGSATDSVFANNLSGFFNEEALVTASPLFNGQTRTTGVGNIPVPGIYGSQQGVDSFTTTFRGQSHIGATVPSLSISGGYVVNYLLTFSIDTVSTFVFEQLSVTAPETNSAVLQFGIQGSSSYIIDQDVSLGTYTGSGLTGTLAPGIYNLSISALETSAGFQFNPDFEADLRLTLLDATPNAIPLPATVWLFGTALIGLLGFAKRREVA
jgi:hypothetical protein